MLYAKVVLGLPVAGPFDYMVPLELSPKIKAGCRVMVNFGNRQMLGYVVGLSAYSRINKLKSLLALLDESALLDGPMLLLTKALSEYYCCSWGEAIEAALPPALRKSKIVTLNALKEIPNRDCVSKGTVTLLHEASEKCRWDYYLDAIKHTLGNGRTAIVLLSDINSVLRAQELINARLGILPVSLYRNKPKELDDWLKIKEGKADIVVGTRSAILAPLRGLGMIIIDNEQDSVYKQDQVPHYHAREAAFMRSDIEHADLIMGSPAPSLEAMYHVNAHGKSKKESGASRYLFNAPEYPAEIKLIDIGNSLYDRFHKGVLSKYLTDKIQASLNNKEKILLFVNRTGFATYAVCKSCGWVLKCPRCNVSLVYHFEQNSLNCHSCNYKTPKVELCPKCNSGYIVYSGSGTEKIESELARFFPQAKIKRLDKEHKPIGLDADIFVSSQSVIKEQNLKFDFVAVLGIDNYLNHIDFRSAEKTFGILLEVSALTTKKMLIQTGLFNHHVFRALEKKDVKLFYGEEFKQRKDSGLAPFSHICAVKLRAENEAKVKTAAENLFKALNLANKNRAIKIIAVNPAGQYKLRGKYQWQILIKSKSALTISSFLKKHLKDTPHSGIIVTVDMDPM